MKWIINLVKKFLSSPVINNEGGYFWIPMAVMAGAQMLQNREQQAQADKQNKIAATQTEFSPWTGQGPGQTVAGPGSMLAAGAKGAAQGAAMGQAYQNFQTGQEMQQLKMEQLRNQQAAPMYNRQMMVNQGASGAPRWGAVRNQYNSSYGGYA
jgi:hypothetical protein